jgi:hypothetical protein
VFVKILTGLKPGVNVANQKFVAQSLLSLCAPLAMEQLLLLVSSFQSLHSGSLLGVLLLGSTMQ